MIESITYSLHAEKRMRERGIDRADVEATRRQPDMTLPADAGTLRAVRVVPGGSTMSVVHAVVRQTVFGSVVHVVTVW